MFVSVIVCTYNRADAIIRCLESIEASLGHAAPIDAEIVVVNNASTDDTEAVVQGWIDKGHDFPVRLVLESKQGVAHARNCSFRSAKGDILVSIDDDCTMDLNHIKNTLAYYHKDKEPVLRFGRLNLGDPQDWPMTIQTRPFMKRWQKGHPGYDYISMGSVCSANMTIPREIIERVGLYDDRFGSGGIPAGEDADFGFRVYMDGYLLEYVPDVIATHYHGRRDAVTVQKLVKNYSIAAGALFAKYHVRHPHIMRKLFPKAVTAEVETEADQDDERRHQIRAFHKKYKIYYPLGMLRFYWIMIKRFMCRS